jgi:hypothetical protein
VGYYRDVASPLTAEMLAPLPEDCPGISVDEPLNPDEYQELADLLERQPDKELNVVQLQPRHGGPGPAQPFTDLSFLRWFPNLRQFGCTLQYLRSLEGIERLPNVRRITIFKSPYRMSAAPLAALAKLESLHLQGDFTDRAALRQLPTLTDLYLVYATKLGDLTFLPPNLTKFGMGRGSVTDISALTALESLQDLSFHKTAMLADLTPLAHTTGLRQLYLAYLNKVTELFDMTQLAELTKLELYVLNHLTDLRPVLTAPNLATLSVYDLPALEPGSWHDTCTGWLAQGKPPFWEN